MPQTIKLKSRKEVAAGTVAFHFEKPTAFTFTPGQAGDFTIPNPPENDAEGNKRSFASLSRPLPTKKTSSSPHACAIRPSNDR